MEYCWLITHSTKLDGVWDVSIHSIHLDEGDALRRVNELVQGEAGILETITSHKHVPNSWEWWSADRSTIITAHRLLVGAPCNIPITSGVGAVVDGDVVDAVDSASVNDQITDSVT